MLPELEYAAFRALQFAQFTTTSIFDEPDDLRRALAGVDGLDADAIVNSIGSPEVLAAYESDRARARTAAGSPTEFQERAANSDGQVRYTAPSLIFETQRRPAPGGRRLSADRGLRRPHREPRPDAARAARRPEDPVEVLEAFDYPLATAEVAAVMAKHLVAPDVAEAERALIVATAEGRAVHLPAGNGALWAPAT